MCEQKSGCEEGTQIACFFFDFYVIFAVQLVKAGKRQGMLASTCKIGQFSVAVTMWQLLTGRRQAFGKSWICVLGFGRFRQG